MAPTTTTCRELSKMSPEELKTFLDSFDTVMSDCDGVLWTGPTALPGSPEVIQKFREMGKRLFFVTNNSTKHRRDYVEKCEKLGFGGHLEEIIGTGFLTACYLQDIGFDKKVYVVGSTGITSELDDIGIKHFGVGPDHAPADWGLDAAKSLMAEVDPDVGGVIVGFDKDISYVKIMKAINYTDKPGSVFVATNADERFPMPNVVLPGTGAIVAAVKTAAEREPVMVGKPSPYVFEAVKRRFPDVNPERTLMIGDRANTDILLGKNCNLQTLLVGTGCHSLADTRRWEKSEKPEEQILVADYYLDKLGDFLDLIK